MSDRTKGAALEKRVQLYLQTNGYLVDRARSSVVWVPNKQGGRFPVSRRVDFFGAFDLIALKRQRPVRLVQVTTSDSRSHRRAKVSDALAGFYPGTTYAVQVWAWGRTVSRGWGFSVDDLRDDGWELDTDFVRSKDAPSPRRGQPNNY